VSQVEYPAVALEREISATLENQKARLQQIGFTYENYLRMIGKTEAELREEIRPDAERRLVRELALSEFARAEKLEVKREEIAAEAARIASRYGERANEVLERLSTDRALLSIHADLLTQAAVRHLTAMLTGREQPQAQAASTEAAESAATSGEQMD
jgi:trigger factor